MVAAVFDIILSGGLVVDVACKCLRDADVCIRDGVIAKLSERREKESAKQFLDVKGKYICPGFIDSHLHIESSLLSPLHFATAAVKHGTTSLFVDPHEIANVAGKRGINLFFDQAAHAPLDIFVGIPSCVPATEREDSGAAIILGDIREMVLHERVYGLAEMMNFPAIIHGWGDYRERCDTVFNAGKIVDGHCPGLTGDDLATYITNGHRDGVPRITSDHEIVSLEEALEKNRHGMYTAMRYGSADKAMDNILPGLIRNRLDLSMSMLCSDDLNPVELHEQGHMDRTIRRAKTIIQEHSDLDTTDAAILAITLATRNPAKYFAKYFRYHGLPEIGEVAVGKRANLVVLSSLETIAVDQVIYHGNLVVHGGDVVELPMAYDYSEFSGSVNVGKKFAPSDFVVAPHSGQTQARVIDTVPGGLLTGSGTFAAAEMTTLADGRVAKIAVIERHHATGRYSVGFVRGLDIRNGAVASTVSHDSHNLVVVGADDVHMAVAANYLIEKGGGMVVAVDGDISCLPLEIGGVMSTLTIDSCVDKYKELMREAKKTGAQSDNLFMQIAFLSLPVIPALRITTRGIVDVAMNRRVGLFV
jgi:adenine deaminase